MTVMLVVDVTVMEVIDVVMVDHSFVAATRAVGVLVGLGRTMLSGDSHGCLLHVVKGVQENGRHMVVSERVHGLLPVLARCYQMGAAQHLEVMRNQRLLGSDDF